MRIKGVKRKCMVRGCSNISCYAVSKTSVLGNSIIICSECAKDIAEALKVTETVEDIDGLVCPKCGRKMANKAGFASHVRACNDG